MVSFWILAGLAAALPAAAETNRSWEQLVQTVKVGKTVVVTRLDDKKVEGKLLGIADDSITVRRRKGEEKVARQEVLRVRYANIRRRNTLIGLAAGAAVGAIIGGTSGDSIVGAGGAAGILAGCFGGIGAAVGGLIPIGKPLYEVEKALRRDPKAQTPRK